MAPLDGLDFLDEEIEGLADAIDNSTEDDYEEDDTD
jgi:hypothetical protein